MSFEISTMKSVMIFFLFLSGIFAWSAYVDTITRHNLTVFINEKLPTFPINEKLPSVLSKITARNQLISVDIER